MAMLSEPPVAEKTKTDSLKIPVDPIHSGLRVAVFGSFIGVGVASFAAGIILIPNGALFAMLLSGASAAGTSIGLERYLKNKWPSGREFLADSERIALAKHDKIESVVDARKQVNVLSWRFEIKKDGPRAKKGWYLLGLALEQDENYVVIYSAASTTDYENIPLSGTFKMLERQDNSKKTRLSSSGNVRRAGEQKRLFEAEIVRQMVGGDMLLEQFVETLEFLQYHYPQWMVTD